ncbi:hypothetical protein LINGRAHAP2_LOCUS5671 [Linum grandiflorum]
MPPIKVAIVGGVICMDTGRFAKAFAADLGSCSITQAEMRAIVEGLNSHGLWVFDGYGFTQTR